MPSIQNLPRYSDPFRLLSMRFPQLLNRLSRADWLALAFLTLAVIAFFTPVLFMGGWLPKGGGDLVAFMWPNFKFASRMFHSGQLPLWNPHNNAGTPFWADNQSAILYPFNLFVTFFTNVPYQAMEALVIFHIWLTGAFMYACLRLLRSDSQLSPTSAAIGALGWMFCDLFVFNQGHIGMISAAAWLPLVFLGTWRAFSQISLRWAALAAVCFGLSILAGHGQMAYLTALLICACAGWWVLSSWRDALKIIGLAAFIGIAGTALSAASWLPVLEIIPFTPRARLGYETASYLSAEVASLRCLIAFWTCDRPLIGYVGLITLALSIIGLAVSIKRESRLSIFLAVLAVVSLLMALGANFPLHKIAYDFVPGIVNFRVPARFTMLFSFSAAILATFGAETIVRKRLRITVLIIVAAELVAMGIGREVEYQDVRNGFLEEEIVEWLAAQPGPPDAPYRIDSASAHWHPNAAMLWGNSLMDIHGYYNPLSLDHYEAYYWSVGSRGTPQYNFLGTKYVIAEDAPGDANFVPVYTSSSGAQVYLNLGAQPLVRLVYTAKSVASFEAGWDAVHTPDWNPDEVVYVINGPALDETRPADASVSFNTYKLNQIAYEVTTSEPAYLVMSEAYYPGWQATIDGEPVPIYRANLAFRAILIEEPGQHSIRLVFRPTLVYVGLVISAISWSALIIWLIRRR